MKEVFSVAIAFLLILPIAGCTQSNQFSDEDFMQYTEITNTDTTSDILKIANSSTDKDDTERYAPILNSYYAAQDTPVWNYFQNKSITKFLAGWVKEATVDIGDPQWNYDSFTAIEILDHDLAVSRPDEQLFCCTFSDGVDRYGYIIVTYDPDGPALQQWGVTETKAGPYDLKAYFEDIIAGLEKTDIDFATATASRVYFFDRENKRADQIIRFTDAKGDNYLYYFGDETFEIYKYQ